MFDLLAPLEEAVAELANTWRPDDPEYRADVYRQIMMQFSYGYFAFFHASAEHPDWAPLWNPVYTLQPNPDDIYLYSPIRGDLTYKVSGTRGWSGHQVDADMPTRHPARDMHKFSSGHLHLAAEIAGLNAGAVQAGMGVLCMAVRGRSEHDGAEHRGPLTL